MTIRKYYSSMLYIIFVGIFLSGCSATLKGPKFQPISYVSEDKALIHIYWTDNPPYGLRQSSLKFTIKIDETPITIMKHGGYFNLYVGPGEIKLCSHVNFKFMSVGLLDVALAGTPKLTFQAEPGQTYYVRCSKGGHNALTMTLVEKRRGIYEIREAKLLPQLQ